MYSNIIKYIKHKILMFFVFIDADKLTLEELYSQLVMRKKIFVSDSGAKFALELCRYSFARTSESMHKDSIKKIYVVHLPVWGNEYAERAVDFFVPSMLSEHNIPVLIHKGYEVRLLIDCDQDAYNFMKNSRIFAKIGEQVYVDYKIIPNSLTDALFAAENCLFAKVLKKIFLLQSQWKYYLLGVLQHLALSYAQNLDGAYLSFMMPDFVFSDGAISKFVQEASLGKTLVLATAYRADETEAIGELKKHINDYKLSIRSVDLTDIITNSMHKLAQQRIVSMKNSNFVLSPQLIFSYDNEHVIRSFHYHPMLVDTSKIKQKIEIRYDPIDKGIYESFIVFDRSIESQIWINNNSDDLSILEISSPKVEITKGRKRNKLVIENIEMYIKNNVVNDVSKYLFYNRYVLNLRKQNKYCLSDVHEDLFDNFKRT